MNQIPKVIHQIWLSNDPSQEGDIPKQWENLVETWKIKHPNWEYELWGNNRARTFVEEYHPDFLETYDAYEYVIEKADVIRYLILEILGGVYVDLDMECLMALDELIEPHTCILAGEPYEHFEFFSFKTDGLDKIPNNGFIASIPNHPFWQQVKTVLRKRFDKTFKIDETLQAILERTGPGMLNGALIKYENEGGNDLHILEPHIINPFTKGDAQFKKLKAYPLKTKQDLIKQGAFVLHYWNSIWWPPQRMEPLINPNPKEVLGFKFYQGVCPCRYELIDLNQGRNIDILAKTVLKNKQILAFDTDGNTMSMVDFPIERKDKIGAKSNEGLYVQKDFVTQYKIYRFNLPHFLADRLGFMNWPAGSRKLFKYIYNKLYLRL